MALSIVFDGTQLASGAAYSIADPTVGPDWGSQAVADALLTGMLRPEELDQAAAEANLTRTVILPLKIKAANADALVTLQQTLTGSLAGASKYAPKTLTVTPNNSTHVSTFKVWGGSWSSQYNQVASDTNIIFGTLTLLCQWPIYGAAQTLGTSGAPLIANQPSPAPVTITPSPTGDIPADVILFVKNRSASAIRSLTAAVVNGNTSWVTNSLASAWTTGPDGTLTGGQQVASTVDTSTILSVASFTTPTLPSDRRFRLMLRSNQITLQAAAPASFRVRLFTGQAEVIGEWRTPPNFNSTTVASFLADMGGYMIPVSEVGSLGAGSTTTTVFVEARGNDVNTCSVKFTEALFLPDDSTLVVETSDTGKTLAAAAATVQLETDRVYDGSGNAAGGVITGSALRVLGSSRVYVYTSQQYQGNMNAGSGYAPENVDVYATVTPRYLHLA